MLASGSVDYVSFDTANVEYTRHGDTVVVTGGQTIELVVRGRPVTSKSRYTVVWVREGVGWRCVAYQSTPVPEQDGSRSN
jgi:ketosteroid isomerase-like protein